MRPEVRRNAEKSRGPRGIVVSAVEHLSAAHADMVVVRTEHDVLVGARGAADDAHDVCPGASPRTPGGRDRPLVAVADRHDTRFAEAAHDVGPRLRAAGLTERA